MPRGLRIEYPGALYHVINRGNDRRNLFAAEAAQEAFERCLFEACERNGWQLEAFCVMSNHFHLVVRTPLGNLSEGMRWLQSTFANRFDRFHGETGRLFQGRFKSLVVEESPYLGVLLDYVHLNPVRAGLVPVERLFDYRWSSYHYLWNPEKRPESLRVAEAIEDARGCEDSILGRREYSGHLAWLAANPEAPEAMPFKRMGRGWALGTKAFKAKLRRNNAAREQDPVAAEPGPSAAATLGAVNAQWWNRCLQRCLEATDHRLEEAAESPKSADWKVLIAAVLKSCTSAPNHWISTRLCMGVPSGVSRYVKLYLERGRREQVRVEALKSQIMD